MSKSDKEWVKKRWERLQQKARKSEKRWKWGSYSNEFKKAWENVRKNEKSEELEGDRKGEKDWEIWGVKGVIKSEKRVRKSEKEWENSDLIEW